MVAGTHVGTPTGAFGGVLVGPRNVWVWGAHAGTPTGAFGGAPYEATKRVMGYAEMNGAAAMRALPLGLLEGLPMGPQNV